MKGRAKTHGATQPSSPVGGVCQTPMMVVHILLTTTAADLVEWPAKARLRLPGGGKNAALQLARNWVHTTWRLTTPRCSVKASPSYAWRAMPNTPLGVNLHLPMTYSLRKDTLRWRRRAEHGRHVQT